MPRIILITYTFRVRRNEGEIIPVSNMFDTLIEYFKRNKKNKKEIKTNDRNFVFEVDNFTVDKEKRIIEGIIRTGDYGYETELYHVDTKVTRVRSIKEAELLPFYFLFYVPKKKEANEGIVILQRIYPYGIKSILRSDIEQYIQENPPLPYLVGSDLVFEMNPLAPIDILNELRRYLKKGDIYQIELNKFELPNDIIEFEDKGNVEKPIKIKLVLAPNRGEYFKKLKERILSIIPSEQKKKKSNETIKETIKETKKAIKEIRELIEIRTKSKDSKQVEYGDLKLRLRLQNNREKTITISKDWIKIRPMYDITENVEIDESTGHPLFKSLQKESHTLLNGFKPLLGHV